MKKLKKIKLHQFNKSELSEREQNRLLGAGTCCICGCIPGSGVSNRNGNHFAYIGYQAEGAFGN